MPNNPEHIKCEHCGDRVKYSIWIDNWGLCDKCFFNTKDEEPLYTTYTVDHPQEDTMPNYGWSPQEHN